MYLITYTKTKSEFEAVATVAQDSMQWKSVVTKVTDVFCELRGEKIVKRREAGKKSERSLAKRVEFFLSDLLV